MTKTVLYTGLYIFLALLPFPGFLQAQESGIRPIQIPDIRQSTPQDFATLPDNIRQIREEQLRLAEQENVDLEIIETPGKSRTIIHSVPDALLNNHIITDSDATELVHDLYPYYGFGGTESLQIEHKSEGPSDTVYRFRQYIDGIRTPHTVGILLDKAGQVIQFFGGGAIIDRDYPRTPQLEEDAAIEAAIAHAEEKQTENVASSGGGLIYRLDGSDIYTEIEEYMPWGDEGVLEPVWTVYIPLLEQSDPSFTHEPFRVNPDGVAVDPIPTLNSARTCDGSQPTSNQSPYCTD